MQARWIKCTVPQRQVATLHVGYGRLRIVLKYEIPCSLGGQDISLSPRWPGFESRRGSLFIVWHDQNLLVCFVQSLTFSASHVYQRQIYTTVLLFHNKSSWCPCTKFTILTLQCTIIVHITSYERSLRRNNSLECQRRPIKTWRPDTPRSDFTLTNRLATICLVAV